MYWLIPANSKFYDHERSFIDNGYIDWRQGINKYQINHIVYIYCAAPKKRIQYKCIVEKNYLTASEIFNDFEYWIDKSKYENSLGGFYFRLKLLEAIDSPSLTCDKLSLNGFKPPLQGPKRLDGYLLNYIQEQFSLKSMEFFPEVISTNVDLYEGALNKVIVNKYERNPIARNRCVEVNGYKCSVCNFDFEEVYGDLGKNFIHVHHVIPIHKINSKYKIDFAKDLIPVCPNCHAMLHRKSNGEVFTIQELKLLLNRKSS
jgi:5-methylcytosine-specific restriction enzyme A